MVELLGMATVRHHSAEPADKALPPGLDKVTDCHHPVVHRNTAALDMAGCRHFAAVMDMAVMLDTVADCHHSGCCSRHRQVVRTVVRHHSAMERCTEDLRQVAEVPSFGRTPLAPRASLQDAQSELVCQRWKLLYYQKLPVRDAQGDHRLHARDR